MSSPLNQNIPSRSAADGNVDRESSRIDTNREVQGSHEMEIEEIEEEADERLRACSGPFGFHSLTSWKYNLPSVIDTSSGSIGEVKLTSLRTMSSLHECAAKSETCNSRMSESIKNIQMGIYNDANATNATTHS
jgi:hypothetical protein